MNGFTLASLPRVPLSFIAPPNKNYADYMAGCGCDTRGTLSMPLRPLNWPLSSNGSAHDNLNESIILNKGYSTAQLGPGASEVHDRWRRMRAYCVLVTWRRHAPEAVQRHAYSKIAPSSRFIVPYIFITHVASPLLLLILVRMLLFACYIY
jgi:hypothetical protein